MTERKRIMVYATEQDYEMISNLADELGVSMSWMLCYFAKQYEKSNRIKKQGERTESKHEKIRL